jgi:hypothetical protein
MLVTTHQHSPAVRAQHLNELFLRIISGGMIGVGVYILGLQDATTGSFNDSE